MASPQKRKKKGGLGRGLDALFQDEEATHYSDFAPSNVTSDAKPVEGTKPQKSLSSVQELAIGDLVPGKYQPRHLFSEEKLEQLAASVKTHGVLQPLLARPLGNGTYEIVAGERRWRAAQQARLHNVPVVIKDIDDNDALEIALIENLQRQDLNPLEEADGYKRLIEEFSYKQEVLAGHLGKSRSHIANMMRLLKLPIFVQALVRDEKLSAGHARALLAAEDIESTAKIVVKRSMSVRETEKYVQKQNAPAKGKVSAKTKTTVKVQKSVDILDLEKKMSSLLGMTVRIDAIDENPQHGAISIEYRDLDQLDNILEKLSV